MDTNKDSLEQHLKLYETADLHTLASMADKIRTALHGRKVFYIRNCHINYTNVCVGDCPICTFSRHPDKEGGFTLSVEDIRRAAEIAGDNGVVEFHVVGGV